MNTGIDKNSTYYSPKRTTSTLCPERPSRPSRNENIITFPIPFPDINLEIDENNNINENNDIDENQIQNNYYYLTPIRNTNNIDKCPSRPLRNIKKRKLDYSKILPKTLNFGNINDLNEKTSTLLKNNNINKKKK